LDVVAVGVDRPCRNTFRHLAIEICRLVREIFDYRRHGWRLRNRLTDSQAFAFLRSAERAPGNRSLHP